MGINPQGQLVLERHVFPHLKNFTVYELGNQVVYNKEGRQRSTKAYYQEHGCKEYTSFDLNGQADQILDLNIHHYTLPPPADMVTDFGTSEHVFNIGVCWKTMHRLTKFDGFIVGEKIFQGDTNHGFYNIQPTFITSFARDNGYTVVHLEHTPHIKSKRMRYVLRKTTAKDFTWPTQDRYREMLGGT